MPARILTFALFGFGVASLGADSGRVTVLYTSDAQPYVEALEGLRGSMGNPAVAAIDLHAANATAELARLLDGGLNRLIVTIGKDALEAALARKNDTALIATMVMQSELNGKRVAGGVRLDISLAAILGELKTIFPQKSRVAILHNPAIAGQLDPGALARARQLGFMVQVVDASTPEESLRALRALNGRADFVVCLPDSAMYNSATVKPLILAALESRLPIVGFSQGFVRAGAAIGVYPDFRDVGAQTGDLAQKQMAGPSAASVEGPRKMIVGVNQRVMRLLGLEYREGGAVVTVR